MSGKGSSSRGLSLLFKDNIVVGVISLLSKSSCRLFYDHLHRVCDLNERSKVISADITAVLLLVMLCFSCILFDSKFVWVLSAFVSCTRGLLHAIIVLEDRKEFRSLQIDIKIDYAWLDILFVSPLF